MVPFIIGAGLLLSAFYSSIGICALPILGQPLPGLMDTTVTPKLAGADVISGLPVEMTLQDPSITTVVLFLSVRCPCSNSHQNVLRQIAEEFSSAKVRFLGIHSNADGTFEEVRDHFKQASLGFPVISDPESILADLFRAYKTPHAFILSGDGVVFKGGVDDRANASLAKKHYLKDALSAIQEGQPPPRSEVRVLGCEIKRAKRG